MVSPRRARSYPLESFESLLTPASKFQVSDKLHVQPYISDFHSQSDMAVYLNSARGLRGSLWGPFGLHSTPPFNTI